LAHVDIVLVNYNAGPQLAAAVESALGQADETLRVHVIVVDNGSQDGSLDALPSSPDLTTLRLGANLGFGAACNRGVQAGRSEFVLFLNPDAALAPGALRHLVEILQRRPDVAVAGPRMIGEDGRVQRSSARRPRPADLVAAGFGLHRLFDQFDIILPEAAHREAGPVDHVIGAAYLIRRSVFEAVGGFDEAFFLYLEDLDLSLRVAERGGTIWYDPAVTCLHAGGGVSRQFPAARLLHALNSREVFAKKHFGRGWAAAVRAASLIGDHPMRALAALAGGRAGDLPAILGLAGSLWRGEGRRP
jgi:GT2 family glycosyltransferase